MLRQREFSSRESEAGEAHRDEGNVEVSLCFLEA